MYVGSLSTSDHVDTSSEQARQATYLDTMHGWTEMVAADYDAMWTRTKEGLAKSYGCYVTQLDTTGLVLTAKAQCASRSLVSLECAQQTGQLTENVQRHLVTESVKTALGISDLTIITELRRQR